METESNTLEEGEISDDSDNYTPLERPAHYSSTVPMNRFPIQDSASEEELQTESELNSDSDCKSYRAKKPKIVKPKRKTETLPKRKKYDIWSSRIQDEVLANTLNNCDVTLKDRSRDVESYDYTLAEKYYNTEENRTSNKRSRKDRRNENLRLTRRSKSKDNDVKGSTRVILDLATTLESTPEEIAKDMANKLYEEKEDLLLRVVTVLGKEKAIKVFKETKRIEADGGMLIMNQTRRRTPGGVYLFLLRHDNDLTKEQLNNIFIEERQRDKAIIKQKQKLKAKRLKHKVHSQKKQLPELLTSAELCVQKLHEESNRVRKTSEHLDVINPPPTPETDGGLDNSGDGIDPIEENKIVNKNDSLESYRKVECYDDEYLDMTTGNEMDLF